MSLLSSLFYAMVWFFAFGYFRVILRLLFPIDYVLKEHRQSLSGNVAKVLKWWRLLARLKNVPRLLGLNAHGSSGALVTIDLRVGIDTLYKLVPPKRGLVTIPSASKHFLVSWYPKSWN